jgi:AAA domain
MTADQYAPPFPPNVLVAVGQVFVGVTVESAARLNGCTISELNEALALPEAELIEPTSEWDSVDLLEAEFLETPDILTGVVPIGVTLISAAPKVGKTRFLTQLSVTAVRGTPFLGRHVTKTKVLTLALEDGARRYRKSLHHLVGTQRPERNQLTIRTTSKRLDEGGITEILQHLAKHPECKLVIIDVLERVRPRGRGTNAYRLDYEALAPLQRMANLRQIAIVVVHHANQRADVTDVFERVSGTSGLIGVVDSLMVLQRRRGDDIGILSVSGREVEDQTIALGFADGWWGPAPEGMPAALLSESREVRSLWLWLAAEGPASTDVLAKEYGRTTNTTQKLLHRLEECELIDSLGKAAPGKPQQWRVVRRDL